MRYLRFRDLQRRGVVQTRQTLHTWIKHYGFPAGYKIAPNSRVWREDEVEAWIAERAQAQEGA